MGHADIKTTQRYLHYKARDHEAELLSDAFQDSVSLRVTDAIEGSSRRAA